MSTYVNLLIISLIIFLTDNIIINAKIVRLVMNIYQLKIINQCCLKCNKKRFDKFILLLRKGGYTYEYIHSWKRFDEIFLPDKEDFYSNLNMEDITDVDYSHAKKVWKCFEIKNLGEYHDLYVQNDALLLANVFKNFRNKCIEIDDLDFVNFFSARGLSWQAALKKTEVKLELLTGINMLLIVEKGIRGGIYHSVHRYANVNNK